VAVCEPAKHDKHWMVAMKEELSIIEKNKTLELVDRPHDKKIIVVK